MEYSNGPNLYEYVKRYKKKYGKCLNEETIQRIRIYMLICGMISQRKTILSGSGRTQR